MIAGGETVQVRRYTGKGKNAHGQPIDTWGDPVDIPDTGVDVPTVTEPRDGVTQNVQWDYWLYLPGGTAIGDRDKVIVRGHECTVEKAGEPIVHMFTAALFRTEVQARRVDR